MYFTIILPQKVLNVKDAFLRLFLCIFNRTTEILYISIPPENFKISVFYYFKMRFYAVFKRF